MIPAFVNEAAPIPPPAYHRAQVQRGPDLHLDALTLVKTFHLLTLCRLAVRLAHQGAVQALKVSPDGSRLASCGDDGAIVIWNLHSGEHLRTLRRDRPYERLNITDIRGLSAAQKASLHALGAFEETRVGK